MKKANRIVSILLIFMLLAFIPGLGNAAGTETPRAVYAGNSSAVAVLKNLDFTDVNNTSTPLKEAIYESSALGALKSYGNRRFGPNTAMTKEEVIATLYRALGQEAAAQKAAEALDNAKAASDKKKDPLNMWSDGYLQLAANDGLITAQDLTDAFNTDQTTLAPESFHRKAAAQRQDMAGWLGKLLEKAKVLQPVYDQQEIFNSFKDWKKADPMKVPYLEALLQNNILHGDNQGNFNPTSAVTKSQAAQILKNAQDFILPVRGYAFLTGTIEGIDRSMEAGSVKGTVSNTFRIRNSDGMLYHIKAEVLSSTINGSKNETNGSTAAAKRKDLVVYKNGTVGTAALLKKGDRIEYIISTADNTVQFVNDFSSVNDTSYYAAVINSISPNNLQINITPQLKLDFPDMNLGNITRQYSPGNQTDVTYKYSSSILVLIDQKESDMGSISAGMDVIVTVKNNIMTEIRSLEQKKDGEPGVVKGIVEDNNPQLGYITLYSENGNGAFPGSAGQQYLLRTYNYGDQNDITVYKNYGEAALEDVDVGDTVFLKLDDQSQVTSVSAMDNYTLKFGRVLSAKSKTLSVAFDDGTQQILDMDKSVFVVQNKKIVSASQIKDGDRVKLLLHITNKFTKLKEVTIEGNEHFITNIYKGKIAKVDDLTHSLLAQNLQVLQNGQWVRTDQLGFTSLNVAKPYKMYYNGQKLDVKKANSLLRDNDAYIAVEKDYGGKEQVVLVSYRMEADTTEDQPYNDSVTNAQTGSGEFTLSKLTQTIKSDDGTIVVKDGRLVTANSILPQDTAYVIANRNLNDDGYYAGVVQINSRSDANFAQIYRGRIQKINDNRDFTVESFAQLNGLAWQYANTPKTFTLTPGTQIYDDQGLVNQREFIDYNTNSYKDRSVYIIAKGTEALQVSTVPYGIYNVRGTLYDITGGTIGTEGDVLSEPTGIKLRTAKVYDPATFLWTDSKDMTLNVLKNTIIIKNNQIALPSDLKKGDTLRIIKKDNAVTGDAYIIMVEN